MDVPIDIRTVFKITQKLVFRFVATEFWIIIVLFRSMTEFGQLRRDYGSYDRHTAVYM